MSKNAVFVLGFWSVIALIATLGLSIAGWSANVFIVCLSPVGIMWCLAYLCYRQEKRRWNNGICADNGQPWVFFDMDSQGGCGFKAGNVTDWFSWLEFAPPKPPCMQSSCFSTGSQISRRAP